MFDSNTLTELDAANVQAAPSRTTRVLAWLNHRLQGYFPAAGRVPPGDGAPHACEPAVHSPCRRNTGFLSLPVGVLDGCLVRVRPRSLSYDPNHLRHAVPVQARLLDSNLQHPPSLRRRSCHPGCSAASGSYRRFERQFASGVARSAASEQESCMIATHIHAFSSNFRPMDASHRDRRSGSDSGTPRALALPRSRSVCSNPSPAHRF